ncbi:MAG: shikimate dehydrogenase [Spirochaetia bacterium]|nr:shikimate dehydrogenase [Spirochaetia bacterium]
MIALVLTGTSLDENITLIKQNKSYIDLVELRIDLLSPEEQKKAYTFPSLTPLPVILTCRRKIDGGAFTESEKLRLTLLEETIKGNFAYIDIEEDIKKSTLLQKAIDKGIEIIRSFHDFTSIPTDLYHRITKIAAKGSIPKIAVTPNSILDVIHLFRIEQELKHIEKKIIIGMGPFGVPTRILYKRLGSMLTFTSVNEIAPGQISAKNMKTLYRGDKVNERTHIYGIIGNPVLHTRSPYIQNPGFDGIKFNAIYIPFLVDNVRSFFVLAEMLPLYGFSVTVPHKQAVLPYLGKITREVKQIGACNTVVRAKNLWMGTNTDYYGFISPLISLIQEGKIQSALVIGAGGAARSVVWALRNHGCKVTIINRDIEKAKSLANLTMSSYDSLNNASHYEHLNLIVQTTSVGMEGDNEGDPIPNFTFKKEHHVYELIYTPQYTPMLQRASLSNATLYYGIDMLYRQGKLQFENFTGYHYPKRLEINLELEKN